MTARAFLAVDVELANAFLAAQADPTIRWVCARVEGEAVCLASSGPCGASVSGDFDGLATAAGLGATEPAFVMFCRDEAPASGMRAWQLVCWVPDAAAPRLKMLYSSSREDLKASLGGGFFGGHKDFCANDAADLAFAHVRDAEADGGAPLTAKELFLKEERAMEKDAASKVGAAAVPFKLDAALEAALASLKAGDATVVEAVLGDCETLLAAQGAVALEPGASVRDALTGLDAPRFVVVKRGARAAFVYYCPEAAPIKAKMTYSTAKATFQGLLPGLLGEAPAKTVEVRDANDLDADVDAALTVESDDRKMTHAANTKPARPGRRGTRTSTKLKKWTPEGGAEPIV